MPYTILGNKISLGPTKAQKAFIRRGSLRALDNYVPNNADRSVSYNTFIPTTKHRG